MKKIAFIVLFSVAGFVALSQAKVEVGLKGGLNLASISQDKTTGVDLSSKTGYHFGAYGLVKVLSFGIQPEILYSTAGTNVTVSSVGQDFSQDLVYLNIPVMVKFYLPLGFNLQAGPQFGQLMSVSGKDASGNKLTSSSYKDADTSIAVGAGLDAPFGLNVAARYIIGLSDISAGTGSGDSKNRTFQLSVGFKLFGVGN